MKTKLLASTIAVAVLLLPSFALATASSSSTLRSAYLQRQVGELQPLDRRDAKDIREDLQSHFDSVLQLLEEHSQISLRVALLRLERQQGIRWTTKQRAYWTKYLSEQRAQNVQRLIAYRNRGLFPQNEGHSLRAVPIFVDRHDTACAVGHLMRESGWEREVDLIEATNLFVYVTDVNNGPLVHWVLQSGLTQEEAALIQPGYPFEYDYLVSDYISPGSSLTDHELVYSEFSMSPSGPLGLLVGKGDYDPTGLRPFINPVGTNWMVVGGTGSPEGFLYSAANEQLTMSFRVRTSTPLAQINQISIQTDYFQGGFGLWDSSNFFIGQFEPDEYELIKEYIGIVAAVTDMVTLQTTNLVFNHTTITNRHPLFPQIGNGVATINLPAGTDFLIEITATYPNLGPGYRVGLGSYVVDFNVVPEPTSMATLSLGLVGLVICRKRRCYV